MVAAGLGADCMPEDGTGHALGEETQVKSEAGAYDVGVNGEDAHISWQACVCGRQISGRSAS